ncbi:MAG TPA: hypothetical protein PKW55_06430 [Spirochaetota bacterium]|nr:hypothetical protein [Spirochaetota bacterium]HOM38520.1 hypothetical protein [Spirochaetota bacterium]HPQ49060.1 hypothetical protein [Spirochaetota bacterium]
MDMNAKLQELLKVSRESYLESIKALSKLQEETEKIITTMTQKSTSFRDESMKLIQNWIDSSNKIREEFQKMVEENLKKGAELIPDLSSIQFPYKAQFEDMYKKIEENVQKFFEMFKIK